MDLARKLMNNKRGEREREREEGWKVSHLLIRGLMGVEKIIDKDGQ